MTHFNHLVNVPSDFSVYTQILQTCIILLSVAFQVSVGMLIACPLINTVLSRNWTRRIRRNIYLTKRALSNNAYWISLDDALVSVIPSWLVFRW